MCSFTYEEQGDKRYLVYEKRADDRMDNTALEMISINKIEGLAASSHMQIDDCFYIKYDVTGLITLREYFRKPVNRNTFFTIFEGILDGAMLAEEYMLALTSYVWNLDYMYVDSFEKKISMIVLPIVRSGVPLEKFFKQLIFEVQYDSTEDCSYVAKLSNLLGSMNPFSISALKGELAQFKKIKAVRTEDVKKSGAQADPQVHSVQTDLQKNRQERQTGGEERQQNTAGRLNIFKRGKALAPEKKQYLDIIYSDEEDAEPKKGKTGLFSKKDKAEKAEKEKKKKEEKKGFWGKWKKEPGTIPEMEEMLAGIREHDSLPEACSNQNVSIPVQNVELNRVPVKLPEVRETVYMDAEDDDATVLMENAAPEPEFMLTRISTNESFKIVGTGVRIGRNPSTTEICIAGNKCVGRVHAILYVQDGQVFIADNHSKNRTFVDGTLLKPEDAPCQLNSGSRIRLGDEELEFWIQE